VPRRWPGFTAGETLAIHHNDWPGPGVISTGTWPFNLSRADVHERSRDAREGDGNVAEHYRTGRTIIDLRPGAKLDPKMENKPPAPRGRGSWLRPQLRRAKCWCRARAATLSVHR